jgi:hypothetical protein
MTPPSNPTKPRHRLLAWARRGHAWGGLIAALFLLVVGSTGILLNYKKPVLTALGLETREAPQRTQSQSKPEKPLQVPENHFSTLTGLGAAGIAVSDALALARRDLGEVPLERIELKREASTLVCKIKATDEREVIVDAMTGVMHLKGRYQKAVPNGTNGKEYRATDWGKIALDLHTGKIGGEVGKALMTAVAVVLVFLSLSGVYLYAKPVLIRRANARARRGASTEQLRESAGAKPRATAAKVLCKEMNRS